MGETPMDAVGDAWGRAWAERAPLVVLQLLVGLLLWAVISPALALALGLALTVSGQPALADQDIARFLLSPAGALAGLAVGALWVASRVVGLAAMVALLGMAREGGRVPASAAIARVGARLPQILGFAALLILRLLALAAPFLAAAGVVALTLLGEYDINYYLTQRPPEARLAAAVIGVLGLGLAAVAVWRLTAWAMALPLIVAGRADARSAFRRSATVMDGAKAALLRHLALWAAVTVGLGFLVTGTVAGLARVGLALTEPALGAMAAVLLVAVAVSLAAGVVVNALAGGALAHLLMARAGWPAVPVPGRAERIGVRGLAALAAALAAVAVVSGGLGLGAVEPDDREIAVIAHRGGAIARPENTLAAFRKGVEDGADWIELDVQENAEGTVVVAHDKDFMKVAGAPVKVWEATSDALAAIDIGGWFDPAYADQRPPTLDEALEAVRGRAGLLIELKYYGHDEALAARVSERVAAAGMDGDVAAMSLYYPQVRAMKAERPDWQVGLLAATAVGRLWALEADFLAVNTGLVTSRLIARAHAAGKPVYAWTVNDSLSMARMASLGVDGLITDDPALARQVLAGWRDLGTAERLVLVLADRLGLDATPDQADGSAEEDA